LDACGVCGGNATTVDARGVCCAGPLDARGVCCDAGAVDECGVCGGVGDSCALTLRLDLPPPAAGPSLAAAEAAETERVRSLVAGALGVPPAEVAVRLAPSRSPGAPVKPPTGTGTGPATPAQAARPYTAAVAVPPPTTPRATPFSAAAARRDVRAALASAGGGDLAYAGRVGVCGNSVCEAGERAFVGAFGPGDNATAAPVGGTCPGDCPLPYVSCPAGPTGAPCSRAGRCLAPSGACDCFAGRAGDACAECAVGWVKGGGGGGCVPAVAAPATGAPAPTEAPLATPPPAETPAVAPNATLASALATVGASSFAAKPAAPAATQPTAPAVPFAAATKSPAPPPQPSLAVALAALERAGGAPVTERPNLALPAVVVAPAAGTQGLAATAAAPNALMPYPAIGGLPAPVGDAPVRAAAALPASPAPATPPQTAAAGGFVDAPRGGGAGGWPDEDLALALAELESLDAEADVASLEAAAAEADNAAAQVAALESDEAAEAELAAAVAGAEAADAAAAANADAKAKEAQAAAAAAAATPAPTTTPVATSAATPAPATPAPTVAASTPTPVPTTAPAAAAPAPSRSPLDGLRSALGDIAAAFGAPRPGGAVAPAAPAVAEAAPDTAAAVTAAPEAAEDDGTADMERAFAGAAPATTAETDGGEFTAGGDARGRSFIGESGFTSAGAAARQKQRDAAAKAGAVGPPVEAADDDASAPTFVRRGRPAGGGRPTSDAPAIEEGEGEALAKARAADARAVVAAAASRYRDPAPWIKWAAVGGGAAAVAVLLLAGLIKCCCAGAARRRARRARRGPANALSSVTVNPAYSPGPPPARTSPLRLRETHTPKAGGGGGAAARDPWPPAAAVVWADARHAAATAAAAVRAEGRSPSECSDPDEGGSPHASAAVRVRWPAEPARDPPPSDAEQPPTARWPRLLDPEERSPPRRRGGEVGARAPPADAAATVRGSSLSLSSFAVHSGSDAAAALPRPASDGWPSPSSATGDGPGLGLAPPASDGLAPPASSMDTLSPSASGTASSGAPASATATESDSLCRVGAGPRGVPPPRPTIARLDHALGDGLGALSAEDVARLEERIRTRFAGL
jgi:hypothetical protein